MKLDKIGAATGDVRLLNQKKNLLTKMVGVYYWIGLNIYKKAKSTIGSVVCCSGCISVYKTLVMRRIIDDFVNQKFIGEACTHSEDRHLANLVLEKGYDVVYVPEAISYTHTPETVPGFLKQQKRWKRGYIRESAYTLTYAWRRKPLLFLQILLWDLTAPFLSFGMRLTVITVIFTNPSFFFTFILPSWITFMIIRYFPVIVQATSKAPYLLTYMVLYEVFLYWMFIYALFTVGNKSWITRQSVKAYVV